ncbi:MAG: flavin-dependent dehydrogenase [Planctomycetota bacterium]|jgi:flavin-dependent dehydrogenase
MYDVVIIGGGPGGSALSCYLSKAGIKNVIFEGAIHPRPHVGESLVTSTTRIFDELDFLEVMEKSGFPKKYGAAWHPPQRKADVFIKFREFPQPGVNQDYTWHVDRSKFDSLLFKHAESFGAKCYQGTRVKEVVLEDGTATGVKVDIAGQEVFVPAKVVVDASGRNTVIGRQLKMKQSDSQFNQFAVHGWFKNVERGGSDTEDDIHIHFLPVERGWVWQIPITEEITSMGVVAEKRVFQKSKKDYAGWFNELAGSAPDIKHAMRDAVHINDFTVEADYSYQLSSFCGNGYLMIGDAARFVDPIFSSGVSVALSSAKFASEVIVDGLQRGDVSEAVFKPYEARLKRGTSIWYEFISLYYKLLPLFTKFIESETHRHQVLQLLQGEVYDRQEVPVLDAMREYIESVERSDSHILRRALDPNIDISNVAAPTDPART